MEQNNDLASVNIKLPQNAVRVMTFHKSKGLEFDYVFLMNLQSRFNDRDLKEDVILSRENGLGMKLIADLKDEADVITDFPYALVKMETFPYMVNKDLKQRAALSEEMRVLYVAFTRAKKKLYLVGKIKDTDNLRVLIENFVNKINVFNNEIVIEFKLTKSFCVNGAVGGI